MELTLLAYNHSLPDQIESKKVFIKNPKFIEKTTYDLFMFIHVNPTS